MKRENAEKVVANLGQVADLLNATAQIVLEGEPAEVSKPFRILVGTVMADIFERMLSPLYKEFPELEPEELRR